MKRQVAVTGMGVVSPIGLSVAEFESNLKAGVCGIRPLSIFDASTLPCRIAGEVPWTGSIARDRKQTFAQKAAQDALDQANECGTKPEGTGCLSLGIGLELFSLNDMAELRAGRRPARGDEATRLTFLQTPSDLCPHGLAHRFGLNAPPRVHVSACAAGTDALGMGFRLVASGRSDWVLAGGADVAI